MVGFGIAHYCREAQLSPGLRFWNPRDNWWVFTSPIAQTFDDSIGVHVLRALPFGQCEVMDDSGHRFTVSEDCLHGDG